MGLFDGIIQGVSALRMKELERYTTDPFEIQSEQLFWLLGKGAKTLYGKQHGFAGVDSFDTYRKVVPITTYDDLRPYIEKGLKGADSLLWPEPVRWYAKSSGTTEKRSKFIPVSESSLKHSHFKGSRDALYMAANLFPESDAFDGKTLALGGSQSVTNKEKDIRVGDLSAIMLANAPAWTNWLKVPSLDIMLMDDWEQKIDMIASTTIFQDVRCLAGVPSWFLTLIQKMIADNGVKTITDIWPNLELFIHGGVSMEPYREIYKKLIPSERMNYLETYNASEGFFGIQSSADDDSLLLMLDYKTYYEFIPMNDWDNPTPKTLTLDEVVVGENYALVITTPSGLWRYRIGDTIRFTSTKPYKFKITGRTKLFINAFGEELMIDNTNKAIAAACKKCDSEMYDYTVAPIFMGEGSRGAHEWIVEFTTPPTDIEKFGDTLDNELRKVNSDYDAKRNSVLNRLVIHQAPQGLFNNWLKSEGKLGGQHKIPRLSNNRQLMEQLLPKL
ncbi:MAG: GH3 auxin-responsive promoter family protein [Odoribacter sp.]|nr:GH3 auxin-responsive promoter family protein [Odoribacter sp.]